MRKTIQQMAALLLTTFFISSCDSPIGETPKYHTFWPHLKIISPTGTNVMDSLQREGVTAEWLKESIAVSATQEHGDQHDTFSDGVFLEKLNAQPEPSWALTTTWYCRNFYDEKDANYTLHLKSPAILGDTITHKMVFSIKKNAESQSYTLKTVSFDGELLDTEHIDYIVEPKNKEEEYEWQKDPISYAIWTIKLKK